MRKVNLLWRQQPPLGWPLQVMLKLGAIVMAGIVMAVGVALALV